MAQGASAQTEMAEMGELEGQKGVDEGCQGPVMRPGLRCRED